MDIQALLSELKNLRPDKQIEKLKNIKKNVTGDQLATIEAAAKEANLPWLSSALLDIVSSKKQGPMQSTEITSLSESHDLEAIKSEAVSDSIGQMLHEIAPLVGSIKLLAKSEVTNFESSGIKPVSYTHLTLPTTPYV